MTLTATPVIALPGDDLHRICVEAVLSQRGSTGELLAAHKDLDNARRLHDMADFEDEPYLFQAVEQAEAHVDRVGWDALVRLRITPLPSLLFAFLTTDDPDRAARVSA